MFGMAVGSLSAKKKNKSIVNDAQEKHRFSVR
jgi:hypothetical protein